jgi:hypothetical protein
MDGLTKSSYRREGKSEAYFMLAVVASRRVVRSRSARAKDGHSALFAAFRASSRSVFMATK